MLRLQTFVTNPTCKGDFLKTGEVIPIIEITLKLELGTKHKNNLGMSNLYHQWFLFYITSLIFLKRLILCANECVCMHVCMLYKFQ